MRTWNTVAQNIRQIKDHPAPDKWESKKSRISHIKIMESFFSGIFFPELPNRIRVVFFFTEYVDSKSWIKKKSPLIPIKYQRLERRIKNRVVF